MSSFAAFTVLAFIHAQEDSERRAVQLIQQLRSDSVEARDDAVRQLKELVKVAVPLLEKAASDPDVEVAGRARRVLQGIALRARLTSNLLNVMPGLEDRLAFAPESEWTEVFFEAISEVDGKRVYRALKRDDLESLAGPALRGVRDGLSREVEDLFSAIGDRGLRSAIPDLILLLRKNAGLSVSALNTLTALRATEAVPELLAILRDPSAKGSSEALHALLAMETRGVARELRKLLQAEKTEPLPLFEALLDLHAGDALPELLKVLKDEHAEVRASAAFPLGDLHLPDSVRGLENLLHDQEIKVRESAARGLAKMRVGSALPTLLQLLASQNPDIRTQACCGLGDLGAKEGLPALRRRLREDPEHGVRSMAAYMLSGLGDPESIPEFLKALEDPDDHVRAWSVAGLRRAHATQSVKEIRERLKDESRFVREQSAWALADLGVKEAAPDIAKDLDDLGIYGVHALRDLGAREYTGAIARLLTVPGGDGQVRRAAGKTLGVLRAREERPAIQRLLSDPDDGLRRDAALALSHLGDRGAIPAIRPLLHDDVPDVREAAIQSLERLADEGSDAVLVDLLGDPFPRVRIAAAESFCRRGRREGVPILLRDARGLSVLNAVRQPKAWTNVSSLTKTPISLDGSVRMMMTRVGSESGLRVEWSTEDAQIATWLGLHQWSMNSVSPLEIFEDISWNGRYTFILELDCLRVVLREDALKFWLEWWQQFQAKNR